MKIEFKTKEDLVEELEDGTQKVIKKNISSKRFLSTNKLEGPVEIYSKRGRVYKSRCALYHSELGMVIVEEPYENVKRKLGQFTVTGFRRGKF